MYNVHSVSTGFRVHQNNVERHYRGKRAEV